MESEIHAKLETLKIEEIKEINLIKEKYALQRGELRKQCLHKFDNGNSALEMAGHPWHSGWDICLICGTYIETNEYGRGEYIKVVYDSDMGHWDGLTKGNAYMVIEELETQYKVKNDFGSTSTIQKPKFILLKESDIY